MYTGSSKTLCGLTLAAALAFTPTKSFADAGGVGFWLPGLMGSMAAAPAVPGWSLGLVYYHTSVSGGGEVAASRQAEIGRFRPNINVSLNATLDGRSDVFFFAPSYTFAQQVFGGQLTVAMAGIAGRSSASIDGTLTAQLGNLTATRQGSLSDSVTGFGDLFPQVNLRWNNGVHNFMIYGLTNIPVGTYDPNALANLGLGHWGIDGGVAYTYLDPTQGNEFSAITGFTYNARNPDTDYKNGIDWHLDVAFAKFLSKQFFVGGVGYIYQQLTADSGQPAILGDFKSRVFGIGPQIGYLFPANGMQGYFNLKGYYEFGHENRPEGWNIWATLAFSPEAPPTAAMAKPMIRK